MLIYCGMFQPNAFRVLITELLASLSSFDRSYAGQHVWSTTHCFLPPGSHAHKSREGGVRVCTYEFMHVFVAKDIEGLVKDRVITGLGVDVCP